MQMENNTRFIKALRYVDDYLNQEAQAGEKSSRKDDKDLE